MRTFTATFIACSLLSVVWSIVHAGVPEGPRCGEFCSFNDVKGYVGPLDTTANLRAALDGLSYKREIVVAHHAQLDYVYQMVHRWQRFGYGHLLMVFPDRRICERIQGAFDKLGCGWYEDQHNMRWVIRPSGGCQGCIDKWLIHYTGARAVRMGYNVLVADADTMPIYDFYGFVRTPPYNNITLFNQREGNFNVNGGMYYIQNAARDGPVAYVLYDHILKNVRWFEDPGSLREAVGLATNDTSTGIADDFLCNDQFSLSDSVHGGITGVPQIFECVFWHHPNRTAWERLHLDGYSKVGPNGPNSFGPYTHERVEVPELLRRGSGGAAEAEMVMAELRIPHWRGRWAPERGGYPFRRELGPLASRVVAVFKEEGGDAAAFPDPADEASAAAADAARPENFAYFPPWLANTHSLGPQNNGNDGWYSDHLTGELPAAISHLHAGLAPGDFSKIVTFGVEVPYGWDFDIALKISPHTAPYLGTEVHGRVPQLLAFTPGAVHPKISGAQFAAMMVGLVRLGIALRRAVVWPWLPCEAPFLRRQGATYDPGVSGHRIPWSDYINTTAAIPYGPGTKSLKEGVLCLVTSVDKLACLRGGMHPGAPMSAPRALLPHEFDHWLAAARVHPHNQIVRLDPADLNTLQPMLEHLGGSRAPASDPAGPPPPLELTKDDLELLTSSPLAMAAAGPLMWLSGPVAVPALPTLDQEHFYQKVEAMCCALHDPPARDCMDRPPGAQVPPS